MKIIIAPDSFKGSITSEAAAAAIERGIKRYLPDADTIKVPIGDGGEGTLDCMLVSSSGHKESVRVTGPLGALVDAEYGVLHEGKIAIIEMAKASGLDLITSDERDPMSATTYGTGELIQAALEFGCRQFILALGGSATNDGGAGMLQALGLRLLDQDGNEVERGGGQLHRIVTIDDSQLDARIGQSQFVIASDVQNPLIGLNGATHIFGPQKGATPELVDVLEQNMIHWAEMIESMTGYRLHDEPGAGAAGGISAAFLAFFPASIERGIDVVIEHSRFREELAGADLVITGEGQIDHQTASGKTPMGIALEAKKFGVPTIALAGSVGSGISELHQHGIEAVFSIVNRPMTLQTAMDEADLLLEQASEQIIRTFCLGQRSRYTS